jgi:hypothetical protein
MAVPLKRGPENPLLLHITIEGGLNNQIWALMRGLGVAIAAGADLAIPCVLADGVGAGGRAPFSTLFDVDHFKAAARRLYGIHAVDANCMDESYQSRVRALPHVGPKHPALRNLFQGQPDALDSLGPEIYMSHRDCFVCTTCAQNSDQLMPLLRPAPRLLELIDRMRSGLNDAVEHLPPAEWCGFGMGLKVVGLHLRNEEDMYRHCKKYKPAPMDLCVPSPERVVQTLCGDFGLPCDRLGLYVATGSPKENYAAAFQSRFKAVYSKHDLVPGFEGLGLRREEKALVEQFVLMHTDLFVGSMGSTLALNLLDMRGTIKPNASLAYTPAWDLKNCQTLNQRFFSQRQCAPATKQAPCM